MKKLQPYNEELLLQQVALGNERSFELLYNHWEPQLSSFIYKLTNSQEITAEIVQDVFLKIWTTRQSLSAILSFKAYLFVMCKNHAISALKQRMRKITQLHQYVNGAQLVNEEADISKEMYALLDEAIEKLSPRQKEVYLLHRQERLTYAQIGETLHIGKESVKTHLQLAVKSISKYLNEKSLILLLMIEKINH